MRLDLFLKTARIVKRRTLAKELCDKGAVRVNGETAKASRKVERGDIVEIDTIFRYLKFRILEVPESKNVSRGKARELVEIIEERKKDPRELLGFLEGE